MSELTQVIGAMEPEEAVRQVVPALQGLLLHLDKERRMEVIASLAGEPGEGKEASLVHL